MKKRLLVWEISGVFFIAVFGTSLHFAFELSNFWKPVAMIAAVNESIWEHLKLVFWPGLLFPLFENNFLKEWVANFWIAKLFSLLIMPLVIALGWYGVVAIIRKIVYKFHLPFMEHIDSLAIIIT